MGAGAAVTDLSTTMHAVTSAEAASDGSSAAAAANRCAPQTRDGVGANPARRGSLRAAMSVPGVNELKGKTWCGVDAVRAPGAPSRLVAITLEEKFRKTLRSKRKRKMSWVFRKWKRFEREEVE